VCLWPHGLIIGNITSSKVREKILLMNTLLLLVLFALVLPSFSDPIASKIAVTNVAGFCMTASIRWGPNGAEGTEESDYYCNGPTKTIDLLPYFTRGYIADNQSVWPQAHIFMSWPWSTERYNAGDNVIFRANSTATVVYTISGATFAPSFHRQGD